MPNGGHGARAILPTNHSSAAPLPTLQTVERCAIPQSSSSPVRRIERDGLRDLALPAVAIRQQPLLVVIELLAGLGGEFEVRALDDGVDRASLLAQPAIDAFHHVDVVARGA